MKSMNTRVWSIGVLTIFIAFAGCGGSGFPTAQVSGRVVCEGKPVEGAMVYFEPLKGSGTNALAGKQGFSYTDADGKFVISTYEPGGQDGAVIGKHRVRVGKGKAKCNCAMNAEVDLMEVEVKADGKNEFELVLRKATAQEVARDKNKKSDDED
jgi:hypothetical protein